MVQNEEISTPTESSPILTTNGETLPEGRYRLVGWSIDTTGRRLIDEICQIAAYTSSAQFAQYIMPYKDINPKYIRRHMIRVINSGRYRMLKDLKSNKFIKTKSAASALTDFTEWLEANRGDASDGIILVYYEVRKVSPAILLETLHHYNLLDRFKSIVKGFANGYAIAQAKCSKTTKQYSLRLMSQLLLNKEEEELSSAVERARAAYEVVVHLGQSERPDLDAKGSGDCTTGVEPHLVVFVLPYVGKIGAEEAEIAELKVLLQRQNTFRPVFGALMKSDRLQRQHASHLRRLLAENNIDYNKLKAAFEKDAKEGLEKVLKEEIPNAKSNELTELLEILDCFFDPEKKPVQPKPRTFNPQRRSRFNRQRKDSRNNQSANNVDVKVEPKGELDSEVKVEPLEQLNNNLEAVQA